MKEEKRNSNIELLRIVLMCMVITLHLNNEMGGGGFALVKESKAASFVLYFYESLSICAVNCFMIISGYFLAYNKTVKLGKIVDLLLTVIFYRVVEYCIGLKTGFYEFKLTTLVSRFLPINYFALFYCVVYCFSPYMKKLFDNLTEKQLRQFVLLLLLLFVLWPCLLDLGIDLKPASGLESLSLISMDGNGSGCTVVQFFVCMVIGMYIRRTRMNPKAFWLFLLYIFSAIMMTFFSRRFPSLYDYCSLFTVISACCLFLLFNKINFYSKMVNYISKSVFAIFCIHTLNIPYDFWRKYFITSEHFCMGVGKMLLWEVCSVVIMFIICLLIDIIIRETVGRFKNALCSKCPTILNIECEDK